MKRLVAALPQARLPSPAADIPKLSGSLAELVREWVTCSIDAVFYAWQLRSYTKTDKYTAGIVAYVLGAGIATSAFAPSFGSLAKKEQELEGAAAFVQREIICIMCQPFVSPCSSAVACRVGALSPCGETKVIGWCAGDYRQVHARLRENAEPVAFYGGIAKEGAGVLDRFSRLMRHRLRVLRTQLRHSVVQVRCMRGALEVYDSAWAVHLL